MTAELRRPRTPPDTSAAPAIDAALDAALVVVRNGGSTNAAERSFANILKAAGITGVSTLWRLDFIAAMHDDAAFVRPVGPIGVNLARVAEATALSQRAASGKIVLADIAPALARISQLPSPYKRSIAALFAAATGACFSQIAGGDWGSFGIAFVAAGFGQFLRATLQARKIAADPVTLTCAFVSALIACVGLRLGYSAAPPSALMASIIYLVPGLPLINGFIDVVSHRHLLVGLERIANAVYLFLLLAIAAALARAILL